MKSKQFCKIFEVQAHQVLYRLAIDSEATAGNEIVIVATTFMNGIEITHTASNFEKGDPEEMFEGIGQKNAEAFYKNSIGLLGDNNLKKT